MRPPFLLNVRNRSLARRQRATFRTRDQLWSTISVSVLKPEPTPPPPPHPMERDALSSTVCKPLEPLRKKLVYHVFIFYLQERLIYCLY